MKSRTLRTILIYLVLVVSAIFLAPILIDDLPSFWPNQRLKLGLDLQGGMHILMEVEYNELPKAERDDAVKSALQIIRNRIDQFGVSETSIQRIGENRVLIQLPGLREFDRAKELIGKTALLEFKLLANPEQITTTITKLDEYLMNNHEKFPYLKDLVSDEQAVETVDDAIGGEEIADADTLSENEKPIVDDNSTIFTDLISYKGTTRLVPNENISTVKALLNDPEFQKEIPAGLNLSFEKENPTDPNAPRQLYLLLSKAELVGSDLQNASVRIGQGYDPQTSGKPYVSLEFTKTGAKKFETVTGQNIKKNLAIVLDDVVYSAPQIQDKIRGGEAQITGSFTLEECQDLVIVLKAGNLPAPVNIIEERTVGPTLGTDSIRAGFKSAIIGLILVVLFMMVYYGLSGFIADLALVFNILFILASLTILSATLTMPGIAGMILTIGMAVDANVLIFERIREEIKSGKTVRSSVDAGFSRALITILDANITTLITAIVLYQFGTGPIKGFAVTLSLGIIGSMFTSIILAKAIFDGFITNKNRQKLSI
ncbi:MAG: protein translocase subunit SecD [Candidatus Cloacimonetes bacterium]|nr:protein translocase subunit SecD [Candidatus Cloacimonadota bacterium]